MTGPVLLLDLMCRQYFVVTGARAPRRHDQRRDDRPVTLVVPGHRADTRAAEPALAALTTVLAIGLAAALWAFCHPFNGIFGDARLYLGRALADLDPAGLGRDLFFANDKQSNYTLFPALITPLVAALGASKAGLLVSLVASAVWFAATYALSRSLASERTALAIVIVSCVLPATYGDEGVFAFAETAAVPRPFAEAAVLAALAAVLTGRLRVAAAFLVVALLLHPIMALAGVGVLFVLVLVRGLHHVSADRRAGCWMLATGIVASTALLLSLVHPALRNGLFARVDEPWLRMMSGRSPYLFPTLWQPPSMVALVAQAVTILIAAHLGGAKERRVFLAVVVSGLGQLTAAVILSDEMHLVLASQAQLWRATWLIGVVGHCALVLAAARLWPRGASARIVLAVLAMMWFVDLDLPASLFAGCLALAIHFGALGDPLGKRLVLPVALAAGLVILVQYVGLLIGFGRYVHSLPAGAPLQTADFLRNKLAALPVSVLAAVWLLRRPAAPRYGATLVALSSGCLLLGTLAGVTWDQRTPYRSFIETRGEPAGFARLAEGRPREVLWLGALAEPWFMLGRPQYLSSQQAAGFVFSRPLALEWWRRADVLVGVGLAHDDIRYPWRPMADDDHLRITPSALATFCGRVDAPGVVVAPLRDDLPLPSIPGSLTWTPPEPAWIAEHRRTPDWHLVRGWTAMPCAPRRG